MNQLRVSPKGGPRKTVASGVGYSRSPKVHALFKQLLFWHLNANHCLLTLYQLSQFCA